MLACDFLLLAGDVGRKPLPLLARQPVRLLRLIGQEEEHDDADDHGRDRLEDVHDLPALEPPKAVEAQQRGRDRRSQRDRDRQRQGKARVDTGAIAIREPVGEVEDEAGEQAGLGKAEQEADRHEAVLGPLRQRGFVRDDAEINERRRDHRRELPGIRRGAGDNPPGDHDPRDPQARAHFFQDYVARDLDQDIAPEEEARCHAVYRRVETEIFVHGQRGEADIDPVEIGEKVGKRGKRQNAQVDFAHCRLFDRPIHHSPREYRLLTVSNRHYLPGSVRRTAASDGWPCV